METFIFIVTNLISTLLLAVVIASIRNWREIRLEIFRWSLNRKIGRWLWKKRELANKSIEDAAQFFEKDAGALIAIENGWNSIPCYQLYDLVKFYNVPMNEADEFLLEVQMMGFRYRSPLAYCKLTFRRLRDSILQMK